MTLVDTNVLLDLVTDDPVSADWSIQQLELASVSGPLCINDVVHAELSVRYERIEALDAFVDQAGLKLNPFPRAALFLAGKALPDFFIVAHAAIQNLPLLTRDVARYQSYFPTVTLISPEA
ncbi:type II toxin-antitoxin system VapC family toxin [Agrobacterium sp. CNPSo 3708]|uniref:type II toxin-antitoxin system VapC family toxin n=1 Tax=Agrobacterium sp. CNPSo 3708 TaxID=3028150 RepID=UPI0023647AAC|nr:type II toxin-antitoxin system VapC family toxin [Agrobacterium sp. CNPSo 3708]MDD1497371.1 type II toxin-antitoxin system VapC family toxin [Agrobacterium sp. CNPSo 3708]